jgi:hypothetical protein
MKPGSVDYLRRLSAKILAYHEKWRVDDLDTIEHSCKDIAARETAWTEIVELAEEIRDNIGEIDLKGKKGKHD